MGKQSLSPSFDLTPFPPADLRNLIQPEQCSYSFTPSRLDIALKKRHSQRWGGLEAPATQGLHLHSIHMVKSVTSS